MGPGDPATMCAVSSPRARLQTLLGTAVLGALPAGLVLLLMAPGVARPAQRVLETLASAWQSERPGDAPFPVPSLAGIHRGLPVYLVDDEGRARAVAHVHGLHAGRAGPAGDSDAPGPRVVLRFAPGEDPAGPWNLRAYEPSRKLGAALEMAVGPDAAARFGAHVATRLERLWTEALLPAAEARLPAFVARIDPTRDTQSRELVNAVTGDVLQRLSPLLGDLGNAVAQAMKRKFDLLDKLGLGLKFLRGDASGIQRKIMPVVDEAARTWWAGNRTRVLQAIGASLRAQMQPMRDWVGGELFEAARDELVAPILAAQRERLESEGEALLRHAADEFVESPDGGFRIRFAGMLRAQLLDKDSALLLLERAR